MTNRSSNAISGNSILRRPFKQNKISFLKEVKNDIFLAKTRIFLLYISTKKHLPIKQARNQESRAEKNHIFLQVKNRFSLCENYEVASHELQIGSYLDRFDSIFEQTVQFTFRLNCRIPCHSKTHLEYVATRLRSYTARKLSYTARKLSYLKSVLRGYVATRLRSYTARS